VPASWLASGFDSQARTRQPNLQVQDAESSYPWQQHDDEHVTDPTCLLTFLMPPIDGMSAGK
jgi:hypothetical protein